MISELTPAVARAQLCAELVKARTKRGMTQSEAAASLEWSWSKVIRIEAGVVGISTTDLRALLALYGGYDQDQTEHLLTLARTARLAPWWNAYKDLVSPAAGRLLDYERQATWIRVFHPVIVPGLVQVAGYAAATVAGQGTAEETARRVELRMLRQEILRGDNPTKATILMAEAALYNRMVTPEVMAAQLQTLAELASGGPVELGVIPFERSTYPAMLMPFTLIDLPEGESLFFNESPHDSRAAKNDSELEVRYADYFRRLRDEHARFGSEAVALIGRALERLEPDADEQHT